MVVVGVTLGDFHPVDEARYAYAVFLLGGGTASSQSSGADRFRRTAIGEFGDGLTDCGFGSSTDC